MSNEFWLITLNFSVLLLLYLIMGICYSGTRDSLISMTVGTFLMWIFSSVAIRIKPDQKKEKK